MSSRSRAMSILCVLLLAAIVQNAWYWTRLPDRVATHFNGAGQPDGWMNKPNAVLLMMGLQLGMPLFLIALTSLSSRLPPSMVNMPHREYWLHPDRKARTLSYMSDTMAWIAVQLSAFFLIINHLTYIANRDGVGLDTRGFAVAMAVYLVSVCWTVGRMLWHFRRPADKT